MKRIWGRALAAMAVSVVAISACVSNDGSLFIQGVLAPPTAGADGTCVYTTTATGPFISVGTLDVALGSQYIPTLLVANQLVERGASTQSRVETNRVQLQGAIVRVTSAAGAELRSYTVPSAGFVDVSTGGTPGYGAVSTVLVDSDTVNSLRQQLGGVGSGLIRLLVYVKVYGVTLGGTHVETGEYQFPVNACFGCLVNFPADSVEPTLATPNCKAVSSGSGGGALAKPCVTGQDQAIDCRLCQGNIACTP
jgi:hypothetical protein